MGQVLFLLTNSFPFGKGETFIDNEMPFWEIFDKVVIMTEDENLPLRVRSLPDNTQVVLVQHMSGIHIILNCFKAVLRKEFHSDFNKLKFRDKLALKRIKHLIGFSAKGLYLSSNIKRLIKEETEKNDKIWLYSYWLNTWAYASAILSHRLRLPAISRAHGYDLYSERSELNYHPLRQYLSENLNGIFPISANGVEYLHTKLKRNDNIFLSRLGTFDVGVSPEPSVGGTLRIVSCSWMSPVKRIERIIAALRMIRLREVEWVHIGDGIMANEIKKEALLLPQNIKAIFKGSMNIKDIYTFYQHTPIHYFVNVSESEGIPVSIMEAISMGIPVIATDVGGISEIVVNGYNGYLLNADYNPADFAAIINKGEYQMKLRQNARYFWNENYNANKNYSAFFKTIILMHTEGRN